MIEENDLIIVGDEAWTREEWEQRERELAKKRAHRRANLDRYAERQREWVKANRPRVRKYRREWMRKHRFGELPDEYRIVASLHDLACTGPTKRTGCRCIGKKIRIVERVKEAA